MSAAAVVIIVSGGKKKRNENQVDAPIEITVEAADEMTPAQILRAGADQLEQGDGQAD